MAATPTTRDPEMARYEEAERRLTQWGVECGRLSDEHGVARSVGVRKIIEHVQRAEAQRKAAREKQARERGEKPRRRCVDCGYASHKWGRREGQRWNRNACPECGCTVWKHGEPTALGKETRKGLYLSCSQLSSEVLHTDYIVRQLPGWMQAPLRRRYLWGQPDRVAADELRMPKDNYRLRLRAAVVRVAEILANQCQ